MTNDDTKKNNFLLHKINHMYVIKCSLFSVYFIANFKVLAVFVVNNDDYKTNAYKIYHPMSMIMFTHVYIK